MKKRIDRGFTLVELSMVMIIAGTIMTMMMYALSMYNLRVAQEHTRTSLRQASAAMMEYARENGGVYPCPADPDLGPGDPQYGVSVGAPGNCAGLVSNQGRDANLLNGTADDTVVIGSLPINSIVPFLDDVDFSDSETVDGWGNKLTYAVTERLTSALTYDDRMGVIDIVDEYDQSIIEPPQTAHLVIVSHGADGYGAHPLGGGGRRDNCGTAVVLPTPPPGVIFPDIEQRENCDDNDVKFLSGLRNETDDFYNDDILTFMINQTFSLWEYTDVATATNTNAGSVGVGIEDPQERLHVDGDIRARSVLAQKVCSGQNTDFPTPANPPNCLEVEDVIDGTLECPDGEVLTAFDRNTPTCEPILTGNAMNCGPGLVAVGIRRGSGGSSLICEAL